MLFFRGISGQRMIRVLLPYLFGLLAVLAVLAFYLKVTGEVARSTADGARDRAVQTSWELSRLASDSAAAALMFMTYTQEDLLFRRLKPDFTDLLGLNDFTLVIPLEGSFTRIPFGQDSLAARAVDSGELQIRTDDEAEPGGLTLFFPVPADSGATPTLSRMELPASTESISFDRYRYMFFILTAAVIVLIIVPAVILRLADLRRRVDLIRFAPRELPGAPPAGSVGGSLREDPVLASLFTGQGTPALIRLDGNGLILDMSPSALGLLDISFDAASGMPFQRLPGIIPVGLESFPEDWRSGSFLVEIEESSGELRRLRFRAEPLSGGGFLLAGQVDSPAAGGEPVDAPAPSARTGEAAELDPGTAAPALPELAEILRLSEEGVGAVDPGSTAAACFGRIRELLSARGTEPSPPSSEEGLEFSSELDRIALALNDVLPDRATVEVDSPGFLPPARCSRQDLTQLIKNLVFYSLESVQGQVRIRLSAREVPSPTIDSVFSARCDRSVGRSVELCYADGGRMPVRLKEALLDPETDASGIRRDFGIHITAAAGILSNRGCHPVFTEGAPGTKLHILFPTLEEPLLDRDPRGPDVGRDAGLAGGVRVVICDASKSVRDSVSEALEAMDVDASSAAGVDELPDLPDAVSAVVLVLDASVLESDPERQLRAIREERPGALLVVTARSSQATVTAGLVGREGIAVLSKPYSPLELMEAVSGLAASARAAGGSQGGARSAV